MPNCLSGLLICLCTSNHIIGRLNILVNLTMVIGIIAQYTSMTNQQYCNHISNSTKYGIIYKSSRMAVKISKVILKEKCGKKYSIAIIRHRKVTT